MLLIQTFPSASRTRGKKKKKEEERWEGRKEGREGESAGEQKSERNIFISKISKQKDTIMLCPQLRTTENQQAT